MISQKSITYYLFKSTEKHPDKIAIVNQGRYFSYQDFYKMVEKCLIKLIIDGVGKNDIIGVHISDSINFCAMMFASSALGASIAPVDKTTPESIFTERFNKLNIKRVITDEYFESEMEETDVKISYPELSGDETMIISLTSGSTSDPKAIELTQNNKYARAKAHIDLYKLDENDIILASTPLYHSLAERLVIMSVVLGATVVIIDDFKSYEWFNTVHKENVSFTITDSSQLVQISQMLYSPFVPKIDSLKTIVSSSSFLENHVKKELINKLNCNLYEIYGTSETSTLTNINLKNTDNIRSVGKPLEGVELKIFEPDEKEIGEIICKTPLIFKGYFNNEKLNENSFEDGYFKTGDLGKINQNGYLFYCGRKEELIKSNGINIYPVDIEYVVRQLDEVNECAVFTYPDDIKNNAIGLAVVLKENRCIEISRIAQFCDDNLPVLFRPEYIFILPELPKNAMGKIMKNNIYENVIKQQMVGDNQ